MTANEIVRTKQVLPPLEQKWIGFKTKDGYVRKALETPADAETRRARTLSTCRYCQNRDTERLNDSFELKEFEAVYKGRPFKAYYCHCCHARWSHETGTDMTELNAHK